MKVIKIQESEKISITAVMVRLKCPNCNSTWRVYLNEDGSFPQGWDVCLKCLGKETYLKNVKEKVNRNDRIKF